MIEKLLNHLYRHRFLYLLFILIYFAFFYGMGYPLSDNNEGLYAAIARNMVQSGNYLIPHLNGVPYIEKPPLLYWLVALSFQLFGTHAFAARMIPALASTILILSLYFFCRKLKYSPAHSFMPSFILTTSLGVILIGRILFFDMLLTAFMSLSLISFYLWFQSQQKKWLRLCYCFITALFFVKGAVGVLLCGAIIFSFLLFSRANKSIWLQSLYWPGFLLFFGAITLWTLLCQTKLPHFAWDTFINEQLYRLLNKRVPHDYYHGHVWYYLPRIIIYLFPWSLLFPALFFKSKKAIKSHQNLFLWLWFLVPFLVFSLGGDKANYYMIVGMPPLALLLSEKIKLLKDKNIRWPFYTLHTLMAIFSIGLIAFGLFTPLLPKEAHLLSLYFLPITLGYTVISMIVSRIEPQAKSDKQPCQCRISLRSIRPTNFHFYFIGGFVILSVLFAVSLLPKAVDYYSQKSMIESAIQQRPHLPIYLYQRFEDFSSISFYVDKPLPIIDSKSKDLYYGQHDSPQPDLFISMNDFQNRTKSKSALVLVRKKQLQEFQSKIKRDLKVISSSKTACMVMVL